MFLNGQLSSVNTGFSLTDTLSAGQSKKTESAPLFKDFLNNSSSKADDAAKYNPVCNSYLQKNENTKANTTDDNVKLRTFRELEKEMKVEARKAMVKGGKATVEVSDIGEETQETDININDTQKTDIMVNCLAQVMGVNADELVKLLEAAGIKPEEIASISQSDTLEAKLTQVLGLDGKISGTLGKILKLIEAQVDEAVSKVLQDENAGKNQWIKLDGMKLKVVLSKDNPSNSAAGNADGSETAELSSLMLKFKLKLKEMGEKLEDNETALVEDIASKIQPVLKNASAMLKVSFNTVETGEISEAVTGMEDGMAIDAALTEELSPAQAESETEQTADSSIVLQQTSAEPEILKNDQAFGNVINQLQGIEQEANVDNTVMKAPVSDREILSQVIEKAKVVITADKSEMVIDLKPDSLGKLSLKVVTEHGMIMAKFVAENQQVKQVLETNMQLLKESLEKQGLNVQGFSVSVRQESQNSRNDYNSHEDGRRRVSTVQVPNNGRMYVDAAGMERLQRINPYRQEVNTINLTA